MKKTSKQPTMLQLKREVKRLQQQLENAQKDATKWYDQRNDLARENEVLKAEQYSLRNTIALNEYAQKELNIAESEIQELHTTIRTLLRLGR